MEKIRIGVIGCGGIAVNKHLPALQNWSRKNRPAWKKPADPDGSAGS